MKLDAALEALEEWAKGVHADRQEWQDDAMARDNAVAEMSEEEVAEMNNASMAQLAQLMGGV